MKLIHNRMAVKEPLRQTEPELDRPAWVLEFVLFLQEPGFYAASRFPNLVERVVLSAESFLDYYKFYFDKVTLYGEIFFFRILFLGNRNKQFFLIQKGGLR